MVGRERKDGEKKAADRAEATLEMGGGEGSVAALSAGLWARPRLVWRLASVQLSARPRPRYATFKNGSGG
jgi:hypothetical protein